MSKPAMYIYKKRRVRGRRMPAGKWQRECDHATLGEAMEHMQRDKTELHERAVFFRGKKVAPL